MPIHIEFEIVGPITQRRTIAVGNSIRALDRLKRTYGRGRWRKMSGKAVIELANGNIYYAEIQVRSTRYRDERTGC